MLQLFYIPSIIRVDIFFFFFHLKYLLYFEVDGKKKITPIRKKLPSLRQIAFKFVCWLCPF